MSPQVPSSEQMPAPGDGGNRIVLFLLPLVASAAPLLHAYVQLKIPFGLLFWLLVGLIALLGLGLGGTLAWLGSMRQALWKEVLRAALLSVLVVLVLDLLLYRADAPALQVFPLAALGLWAVLTGVFWAIRGHVAKILFIGAAAIVVSTLALPLAGMMSSPASGAINAGNGPARGAPVIYIVLDEMIGPEAIPRDIAGGEVAYQSLRQLFDRHGFRLYGRAFSRHALTARSVPNTLNFDLDDAGRGMILQHASNGVVQAALFDQLAAQRPLAVFQTKHMDFCNASVSRCGTLPSYDAQSPWVRGLGFGLADDLAVLQDGFSGSLVAQSATWLLGVALGLSADHPVPEYFDVHAFPAWFDHISEDVTGSGGDWNYFIHLLSPHSPYLLDANCIPGKGWELPYNLSEDLHLTGQALEDARNRHYRAYFIQLACLTGKLDAFFSKLDQMPELTGATIVLHGDHGSRISAGRFAETVSERDLLDNHAALYAIRAPGVAAGYDLREASVQALTAEYFGARARSDDRSIVIDARATDETVILPMPDLRSGQKMMN